MSVIIGFAAQQTIIKLPPHTAAGEKAGIPRI
jgi:hypothetical protein